MNKQGKTSMWMIFLVVVIAGIAVFFVANTQLGEDAQSIQDKELVDCETAPSIELSVVDAINKGSIVGPTSNHTLVDGAYTGASIPTNLQRGNDLDIILSAANFLDTKVELENVDCGVNYVYGELFATDDATFKVFNDNGNVVTDGVAAPAVNQSASSTPITQRITMTVNADESVGDLVIVVEGMNTTQLDQITLSSSDATVVRADVPEVHNPENTTTTSLLRAFDVSGAKSDGSVTEFFLTLEPESGETIDDHAIYITGYTKQWFVEVDGSFAYGVENSDGTLKYEDTFDHDYYIHT